MQRVLNKIMAECKQCKHVTSSTGWSSTLIISLILNQLLISSLLIDISNSLTSKDPLISSTARLRALDRAQSIAEQLDDTSSDQTSKISTVKNIKNLPRVTINGKRYIHTSLLASKYT